MFSQPFPCRLKSISVKKEPLPATGTAKALFESVSYVTAKGQSVWFLSCQWQITVTSHYRKIYFRINRTVSTYIRMLIFLSFAFPVNRFSSVQEITPIAIPSEML